jgi:hypothetical protein
VVEWAAQKLEEHPADSSWLLLVQPTGQPAGLEKTTALLLKKADPGWLGWEQLRDLLDSDFPAVRNTTASWIGQNPHQDLRLLTALLESPWPEVRALLLQTLQTARLPTNSLHRLWATTLLAVRGQSKSLDRARALKQLASRFVEASPQERPTLARWLKVALESANILDRRAAIGVLVRKTPPELEPELEQLGIRFI